MTEDRTTVQAVRPGAAHVERHFSDCPRLTATLTPVRNRDARPCTCDPERLDAALRPAMRGAPRPA
jgi:hypothetical protein